MITFYLHLIEQNTIWMQPGHGTGTSTLDMQVTKSQFLYQTEFPHNLIKGSY